MKTTRSARMTGRTVGNHAVRQCIPIAIGGDFDDALRVTGGLTLAPERFAASAIQVRLLRGQRFCERLAVGPSQRQDRAAARVADDHRKQTVRVPRKRFDIHARNRSTAESEVRVRPVRA